MLYLSTDYVFDGKGDMPWKPNDKCYSCLNVYGQCKLAGGFAVLGPLEKTSIIE